MKYKYKYKYKFRQQQATGAEELLGDSWDFDPALQTTNFAATPAPIPSAAEEEGENSDEYFELCIPTDAISLKEAAMARAAAHDTLDHTWKQLAASSPEKDARVSPRKQMQEQRETIMPTCRWLQKLRQLDDLVEILSESKTQAADDARKARGMSLQPTGDTETDRETAAEDAGNAKVQQALHELGETEVNSHNLMHTTKQYSLLSNLRKRLGLPAKSSKARQDKKDTEQDKDALHAGVSSNQLYGDWSKSVLVSTKKKKVGSLGKMNKTFKEFRADPWERLQIVKAQERSGN